MKNLIKRIFILSTIILSLSMTAFAYEDVNGDVSPDEAHIEIPETANLRDKELDVKKEDFINPQYNDISLFYVPETYERYLNVPMYMQKNGDYCGPACVEMVIDFYRGSVYNQETYASYMGTDHTGTNFNQIARALNNYQNKYHYDVREVPNFQAMLDKCYYSMKNSAPVIADINTQSLYNRGEWAYPTSGHYIVIRSIYYDRNTEMFTGHVNDPWKVGKTKKTYRTLYNGVNDHWASVIIH